MTSRGLRLLAAIGLLLPLLLVVPTAPSLADRNEAGSAATADLSRRLSIGHLHTCSVLDTGGVQCWGSNDNGRLGNGTTATTTVPVLVSGLSAVTDISAGGSHTCARLHGGSVRCWGLNGNGQLGNGSTTDSLTPVTVTGLTGATSLSAGGFHTCAVVTGGLVRCWGHDGMGQTGDGSPGDASATPTTVGGITAANPATAVSTGEFHSCALLQDGTVKCWGHNGFGQLGADPHAATPETEDSATAVPVVGLPDPADHEVVALTTGSAHTCALLDDDTVFCWGQNAYGQLGYKTDLDDSGTPADPADDVMKPSPTPKQVQRDPDDNGLTTAVTPLTGARSVSAGQYHNCTLQATGGALCWGNNQRGQLGRDPLPLTTPKKTEDSAAAISVAGLAGAQAVGAGGFHSCALVGTSIRCWGYNFFGQLGGFKTSNSSPVTVTAVAGARMVTAGTDVACALIGPPLPTDATPPEPAAPFCWGGNANGRLGNGTSIASTTVRVPVSGFTAVDRMDAGNGHACAIPLGSGAPQCWGFGTSGQLGNSATADSSTPVTVAALTTASTVDAGGLFNGSTERGHSCAVRSDTKVVCWGANGAGQLGDESTDDRSTPVVVRVDTDPDPDDEDMQDLNGVAEVVTGGGHSCARKSTGAVLCWGSNGSGQLGDNTTDARAWADTVQDDDDADDDNPFTGAVALTAGENHTCALKSTGKLMCWGSNGSGRLGDGSTTNRTHPVEVAGLTPPPLKAVLATAGASHTCASLDDGSMWCWGENGDGQLGNGSNTDSSSPVVAFDAPGVSAAIPLVTSISASRRNTCARLIDSSVSCWGDNTFGQLGDGIGPQSISPVTVTNLLPVAGNHIPEPADDTAVTTPNSSVTVPVLANDIDADAGDTLVVTTVSDPAHGDATDNGDGTVTYDPDTGYCGSDTFTYAVSDGTAIVPATVTITMNCGPVAVNDAATTAEDTPVVVAVRANDSDPDGDTLTVTAVGTAAHGTVAISGGGTTVTYDPADDFCSPPTDTFGYTISDGNGHTATAAVTVTVTCVNDAPRAQDDIASTPEDTPVLIDVLANDAEVDGGTLSLTAVTSAAHGTVTIQGTRARYVPAANYCGADTFDYTSSDGTLTDTATVDVSVTCSAESPDAHDDQASTVEDTATTVAVLANDIDPDGDALMVTAVTDPPGGTATPHGSAPVDYLPDPDFCGTDTFQYVASDGTLTDTATVTVTVSCVNDPPVAADDAATVAEDSSLHVHVVTNDSDPDGDVPRVTAATDPAHGTTTVFDTFVRYTPDPDYCGGDAFDYTIKDPSGASDVGHVSVTVTCRNDAPVLAGVADQTTVWGENVLVLLSATDADASDALTFSLAGGPAGATVSPSGAFSWTPGASQVGSHLVSVRVSDGTATSTTSFSVTVSRRLTSLVYTGGTTGEMTDPVGVSATLTDTATGAPITGRTVVFTVRSQTTSGGTDATGSAAKTLILLGPVGATTATSDFAGDSAYRPSSDSDVFTVLREAMTTTFSGQNLTLTSSGSAAVTLRASLAEAADGFVAPTMGSPTVSFRALDGTLLCSGVASNTAPGQAAASCTTAALAAGTRAIVVSTATPAYVGPVDVAVVTVALVVRGDAAGAGQAGGDGFGFVASAQRKGGPLGGAVHVVTTPTTATVVQTSTLSSLTTSCTGGSAKVCKTTVQGTGATTRQVDLDTGAVTPLGGTSAIRIDATDTAEPAGAAVPADRYAVAVTGTVSRTIGTAAAQVLISEGNVRVPS